MLSVHLNMQHKNIQMMTVEHFEGNNIKETSHEKEKRIMRTCLKWQTYMEYNMEYKRTPIGNFFFGTIPNCRNQTCYFTTSYTAFLKYSCSLCLLSFPS